MNTTTTVIGRRGPAPESAVDDYRAIVAHLDTLNQRLAHALHHARTAPDTGRADALHTVAELAHQLCTDLDRAAGGWPPAPAPDEAP